MKKPNYSIEDRTKLMIAGQTRTAIARSDDAFDIINESNGSCVVWSYNEVLSFLTMPGASTGQFLSSVSAAAAKVRDGGRTYKDTLSPVARDQIDFRKALIYGVDALEANGLKVYAAALDKKEYVPKIIEVAQKFYQRLPIVSREQGRLAVRGGSPKHLAVMPQGRTIWKYREDYHESGCNEMVLADKTHLRGNRTNHGVSPRVWELIAQAIEETYLDRKATTPAAVLTKLQTLITEENFKRDALGLRPLKTVSYPTIRRRISRISPTAQAIARDGLNAASNARMRGRTDTRALKVAELLEMDECKLSLMTACKKQGWWERFTAEEKIAVEEIEEIIKTRLWLIVALDVATRMPLGWALTDKPGHEATLEVLRMVTRDKTKEKVVYGCESDPMPAVGIGAIKTDNGSGLRNSKVKGATLGLLSQSMDCRTYSPGERPHIEKLFDSFESTVANLIHGYTGRKAGHLKGYDPIKNGVFDTDELFGIITRYFVDEYPFRPHGGMTMRGMRPIKAYEQANEEYGCIQLIPEMDRRIQLGWRSEATVTDEGVKAFGLPYWSPELQELSDSPNRKVTVYSDPDCTNEVTVLVEGRNEPILGVLAWTALSDLTIPEALEYQAMACAEEPGETEDFEARLARARRRRFDDVKRKGLEKKLARSFMTIAEAEAKAETIVFARSPHQGPHPGSTPPGMIGSEFTTDGVHNIGDGFDDALDAQTGAIDEPRPMQPVREYGRPNSEGKLK